MLQEPHKTITLSEFYNELKENQKVGMRQWVKLYTVVNGNSHDRLIDGRVYFYELKGYMDLDELKDLLVIGWYYEEDGMLCIRIES